MSGCILEDTLTTTARRAAYSGLALASTVAILAGCASAPEADGDAETVALGLDLAAGEVAQVVVPAHIWQRTVPGPADALVSCLVSPGFDFADFELADSPTTAAGEVQRASAGPADEPVDPTAPINPA